MYKKKKKKVVEKLINIKDLKFIELNINLNDDEIAKIEGENTYVKKIKFNKLNSILNNFIKKFPNITEVEFNNFEYKLNNFEIKEAPNYKINTIQLNGIPNGILYISFENLINISFNLTLDTSRINIDKIFPLFNANCNSQFGSLTDFTLNSAHDININNINNFVNNLNLTHTPNIKHLIIMSKSCEITEESYYNFVGKILSNNNNSK